MAGHVSTAYAYVVFTRSGGPAGVVIYCDDGYLVPLDVAMLTAGATVVDQTVNIEMGRKAHLTIERRYDERVAGEVFVRMWARLVHKAKAARCAG
jgi:hypothetical protein